MAKFEVDQIVEDIPTGKKVKIKRSIESTINDGTGSSNPSISYVCEPLDDSKTFKRSELLLK